MICEDRVMQTGKMVGGKYTHISNINVEHRANVSWCIYNYYINYTKPIKMKWLVSKLDSCVIGILDYPT